MVLALCGRGVALSLRLSLLVGGLTFPHMWKKASFIIFSIMGFFVLSGLGVWQVYRLQWKTGLLEAIKQAEVKEPLTLEKALLEKSQDILFHPIQLKGTLGQEIFYVIGRTHGGKQGYHAIASFIPEDGPIVLLNMGWVPHKHFSLDRSTATIKGFIRVDEKKWFTPGHIIEKNEWGFVDVKTIGSLLEKKVAPFYVAVTLSGTSISNKHLSYAITWFLLAIAWGIFMGYFYRRNLD